VIDELVQQAEIKLNAGPVQGTYDYARRVLGMSRANGRALYLLSYMATTKDVHSDVTEVVHDAVSGG
jgi:hypothetical protein